MIDPHCGPTNVRHRLHFPLAVPSSGPVLTVANDKLAWNEGCCFVFDDSLVHSVQYPVDSGTNSCRVVLIVDLWHPDLTAAEREAIANLYPA
jgi:aspartate beta-hydroxylase